ncbi:hypothetical protein DL93DRAFT_2222655 [Clavulina sp. PMI_390]|nr:hypothetical protein DL93DRAFT_2222655 [Clavulina sp. PMI_390]
MSAATVAGNVSDEDKMCIIRLIRFVCESERAGGRWSYRLLDELELVSVDRKPQHEGRKSDIEIETEIIVKEFMCNTWLMAHGGMISTLLDFTTSLPVPLLLKDDDAWSGSGLSLSLSVNLLSPALKGDKLRCIVTSKSGGKRTATSYGELWGPRGLVATATHIKMVAQQGAASQGIAEYIAKL